VSDVIETILANAWRPDSRVHGIEHWRAVAETGSELAALTEGADADVVWLFGWLHDTRREHDGDDPHHGERAEAYARQLHAAGAVELDDDQLEVLCLALRLHAAGQVSGDPTVGCCWDADRLHLPRTGTEVDPTFISTRAALERCASMRALDR